jgi:hypothetical protein
MTLAATTYAANARLDLYFMQQSKTTQDPNSRSTPLPKPQPAATTSFQGSGSPPAMAGPGNDPVQVYRTGRANHWEFLRLWTGFELPSSCVDLP